MARNHDDETLGTVTASGRRPSHSEERNDPDDDDAACEEDSERPRRNFKVEDHDRDASESQADSKQGDLSSSSSPTRSEINFLKWARGWTTIWYSGLHGPAVYSTCICTIMMYVCVYIRRAEITCTLARDILLLCG